MERISIQPSHHPSNRSLHELPPPAKTTLPTNNGHLTLTANRLPLRCEKAGQTSPTFSRAWRHLVAGVIRAWPPPQASMRAKKLDKQSDLSSAIGSSAARGLYDALGERPFGGSSARSQGSSGGPRRTRKRHEKEELESGVGGTRADYPIAETTVGRKFRNPVPLSRDAPASVTRKRNWSPGRTGPG